MQRLELRSWIFPELSSSPLPSSALRARRGLHVDFFRFSNERSGRMESQTGATRCVFVEGVPFKATGQLMAIACCFLNQPTAKKGWHVISMASGGLGNGPLARRMNIAANSHGVNL